jgi:hypothetical protein
MAKQELLDYIKKEKESGKSIDEIKALMLKAGHPVDDIKQAIDEFSKTKKEAAKKLHVILFFCFGIISILLLKYSGLTVNAFLFPATELIKLIQGEVNLALVILALMALAASLAFLFLYTIKLEKMDRYVYIGGFIICLTVIFMMGFSVIGFFTFIGAVLALYWFGRSIKHSKEYYKKIHPYAITSSTTSNSLRVLILLFVLGLFFVLYNNPLYGSQEIDNIVKQRTNLDVSSADSIQNSLKEQERNASYQLIDAVEQSVMYGMYNAEGLTNQERLLCFSAINDSMESIDALAKAEVDKKMVSSAASDQVDNLTAMLDKLKSSYPLIVPLLVLSILEFLRILVIDVAGLIASIVWKIEEKN